MDLNLFWSEYFKIISARAVYRIPTHMPQNNVSRMQSEWNLRKRGVFACLFKLNSSVRSWQFYG